MWKTLLTLFICLNHLTVLATTKVDPAVALPVIFSDLKYDLEVNWDQNNQKQYQQIITRFNQSILDLQSQGMSNDTIIKYVRETILEQEAKQDLDNILTSISINKLTEEEASHLIIEQIENNNPTGSHWLSTGKIASIVVVAAIMIVATIVVFKQMGINKGDNSSSNLTCRERYICINYYETNGYLRTSCDWEPYCY